LRFLKDSKKGHTSVAVWWGAAPGWYFNEYVCAPPETPRLFRRDLAWVLAKVLHMRA
jgi:hypothetical protein